MLERATRIELAFSAWEADVLPLNYARVETMVLPTSVSVVGGETVAKAIGGAEYRGHRYGALGSFD